MVAAHRGDWQNAPESSLLSIENCITNQADIVELDVTKTLDGRFVILHDGSLDRTTTGSGDIKEKTLAEVRLLCLLHEGRSSSLRVPTLAEALETARERIIVNLDVKSGDLLEIARQVDSFGVAEQVVLKMDHSSDLDFGTKIIYMPIVERMQELERFLSLKPRSAVEIIAADPDHLLFSEGVRILKDAGARIWVNALWEGEESGGRGDQQALLNPCVYGELIDLGINIIQTDYVEYLVAYLKACGLHLAKE
jgi:glycerophosphoryl diester phosphodiesterase